MRKFEECTSNEYPEHVSDGGLTPTEFQVPLNNHSVLCLVYIWSIEQSPCRERKVFAGRFGTKISHDDRRHLR